MPRIAPVPWTNYRPPSAVPSKSAGCPGHVLDARWAVFAVDGMCSHKGGPLADGMSALGGVLLPLGAAPLQAATGKLQMPFGVLLALTVASADWFVLSGWTSREKVHAPQAAAA